MLRTTMHNHTFLYHIIISLLFLSLAAGCGKPAQDKGTTLRTTETNLPIDDSLRQRVSKYIGKKDLKEKLAFCLYDITAEKMVYAYREDSLMPPASCLKLLTGIAAVKLLGPNFSFPTRLYTTGKIENGTLRGDLIISGGLSPMLTSTDLIPLFQNIRTQKIQNITGRIILALDVNERPTHEEHWIPGDLKRRKYGFFFQGKEHIEKEIAYLLHAQGLSFPHSSIVWAGIPKDSHCIGTLETPIKDVLMTMWKHSANEKSESLLYTLGKYSGHKDSLRHYGLAYLEKFIQEELGRDSTSFRLHDGCGMCIHNALTASLIIDLLRYAYQNRETYNLMQETLPKSGVDGTLLRRLQKPRTKGRIIAKTGTLTRENGISSLSGYFKDKQGHLLCFSIMNNHIPIADAQLYQDKLCNEFLHTQKGEKR